MIIDLEEYKKFKKNVEIGRWLTMDEVLSRVSISRKTFTEKVLSNSKFREELETFVHFPKNKGEKYYFLASKTIQFLEIKFPQIMKEF